jgi:hypothetical protein
VHELAVDGDDVMSTLGLPPGPEVGRVLQALLDQVIESPELNTRAALLQRLDGMRAGDPRRHGVAHRETGGNA